MPVDEAFRPLSAWEAVSLSQETGRRSIPGYPAEGLGDPAEGLGVCPRLRASRLILE
jgi:hypothetical protein